MADSVDEGALLRERSVADAEPLDTPAPAPETKRRRRRTLVWWAVGVVFVALVVAVLATVHVNANRAFDRAAAAVSAAEAAVNETSDALISRAQDAADSIGPSEQILGAVATGEDLVDATARTRFTQAQATVAEAVATAKDVLSDVPLSASTAKPLWTWELLEATPALRANAAEQRDFAEEARATTTAVDAATDALEVSATAMFVSVPPAAAALETANVSAGTQAILDFRDAAAAAAQSTRPDSAAVQAITDYAARAASLKESAQRELAEKAGPLLATRLEIEAYARSIAGGVLLEFDWSPIVNGLGGRDGMAGTATWNTARGGFSTITLSNSVAEEWPSPDSRALVAHEVGHSITSKCSDMFDSDSQPANEAWATAWAISLGHIADGNGVQAYGYPPQAMIDAAAGCR